MPILDAHGPRQRGADLGGARRTTRERVILSIGAVASSLLLLVAGVVGWGAYKLSAIDRADLALDLPSGAAKNYLIVGSDSRAKGNPNRRATLPIEDRKPLADTMMILRVDPDERRPMLLSLPRDLWVTRSGDNEQGRINSAYGEGPQALVDTIRDTLDIPINHYIEVDFQGFKEIVDAIGGVPVWFDMPMRDWQSDLEVEHSGCKVLDGYDALAFARARHLQYWKDGSFTFDGTGDLGRISRQQFFIRLTMARVIAKAGSNPLTLKRLVDAGTANVTLDDTLPLSDLVKIGNKFSSASSKDLLTFTLPTTPRTTSGGAKVLELDAERAPTILDRFRTGDAASHAPTSGSTSSTAPTAAAVPPSSVTVIVLNSSGAPGAAAAAARDLAAAGFTVPRSGNGIELGHSLEAKTSIRYAPGREDQAQAVDDALARGAEISADSSLAEGSVVLFLGTDYAGVAAPPASSTTTSTTIAPGAEAVEPSSVTLTVLNSSAVVGAAAAAAGDLTAAGFTVARSGNGAELGHPAEARSIVRYAPGAEARAERVAAHVAGGAESVEDPTLAADEVVLFLGAGFTGITAPPATTTPPSATTTSTPSTTTTIPSSTKVKSSKPIGQLPMGTPPKGERCG